MCQFRLVSFADRFKYIALVTSDATRGLRYTVNARPCAADARAGSRPGFPDASLILSE